MEKIPDNLRVTLIQTSLFWESPKDNLQHFEKKIIPIENTDLVVLPEMFTTGFTMQPQKFAEVHEGEGLQWMKRMAEKKQAVICGSIAVKEGNNFFNRLYWVRSDGSFVTYDKRHLFRMAGEDKEYSAGEKRVVVEINGWKILLQICYDLRFPVFSRNRWDREKEYQSEYDAVIYVANWPEVRSYPWKTLLAARAIENQAYVIGVNRIGLDGNSVNHSGDSGVFNPRGEKICTIQPSQDCIETVELSYGYLEEFRKVFPVGRDAD